MAFNLGSATGNIFRGRSVSNTAIIKKLATGLISRLAGEKMRAMVYISNLETGERLVLAWTPEKVTVDTSGRFQSYNIIEEGEVKIPRGMNLTKVKWSGKLPGSSRVKYHFVSSAVWQEPKTIIQTLKRWQESRAKLHLLITQTSVNLDVFLSSFNSEWSGGHGDADYDINFIAAKDMVVKTVQEADAEKAAALSNEQNTPSLVTRGGVSIPGLITAVQSDSLWSIAEQTLGDGSKWQDVYSLNQDKLDSPESLKAGDTLKIPQ